MTKPNGALWGCSGCTTVVWTTAENTPPIGKHVCGSSVELNGATVRAQVSAEWCNGTWIKLETLKLP